MWSRKKKINRVFYSRVMNVCALSVSWTDTCDIRMWLLTFNDEWERECLLCQTPHHAQASLQTDLQNGKTLYICWAVNVNVSIIAYIQTDVFMSLYYFYTKTRFWLISFKLLKYFYRMYNHKIHIWSELSIQF